MGWRTLVAGQGVDRVWISLGTLGRGMSDYLCKRCHGWQKPAVNKGALGGAEAAQLRTHCER